MSNRLSTSNSPYLLQHADNPVAWHPWDAAALELAERLDRPILLSIGYAACHWCHVMAHESFEDPKVAEVMNRLFVCIKVDREERPDLDRIYQTAHQILTSRPGGWPLTVALTPRGHAPIFAGTYFPPEPRHGMPGFVELMERIASHYREKHSGMEGHVESFRRALSSLNPPPAGGNSIDMNEAMEQALEVLKQQFDPAHGGFGDAPKFPHPTQLEVLLRISADGGNGADLARAMLLKTLKFMHRRGLYDQLDGGFFRYSVDREWRVPHFEKMLYDNAQLLGLYADAWDLIGDTSLRNAAAGTAGWVISEMQLGHGGYAATLDADSEGEEGRYYVWEETDLRAVLTEAQYNAVESRFGLVGEPNFEGKWHLNLADSDVMDEEPGNADDISADIESALDKMRSVRRERVRPGLDDKILTSWNGLMIRGMARAARYLGDPRLVESARRSADFVHAHLFKGGRLLVSYREGRSALDAYLDDYAFLAEGLMELLQVGWRDRDFTLLRACCEAMLEHFEDPDGGGFYYTAHDHESLLYRPKTGADDAIPAGNGSAVRVLHHLGLLLGESRYVSAAERTLDLFASEIKRNPSVLASLLLAAGECHKNSPQIVLRGSPESLTEWTSQLNSAQGGRHMVFPIPASATGLPQGLAKKTAIRGGTTAYLCRGFQCSAPINDLEVLLGELEAVRPGIKGST